MKVVIILIVAVIGISFVIGGLAGYEPAETSQAEDSIMTMDGTIAVGVDTPPQQRLGVSSSWPTIGPTVSSTGSVMTASMFKPVKPNTRRTGCFGTVSGS